MRQLHTIGRCERCGIEGPVWKPHVRVLNFGTGLVMEPKAMGPTLCDECEQVRVAEENAGTGEHA